MRLFLSFFFLSVLLFIVITYLLYFLVSVLSFLSFKSICFIFIVYTSYKHYIRHNWRASFYFTWFLYPFSSSSSLSFFFPFILYLSVCFYSSLSLSFSLLSLSDICTLSLSVFLYTNLLLSLSVCLNVLCHISCPNSKFVWKILRTILKISFFIQLSAFHSCNLLCEYLSKNTFNKSVKF